MKEFFAILFSERTKTVFLRTIAILLFVAALVCAIIALTKPESSDNPGGDSEYAKINDLESVKKVVSYTDMEGTLTIDDIADILIVEFIKNASGDDTAFTITSVGQPSKAVIDSSMDTSNICSKPLDENTWFVSANAPVKFEGDLITKDDGCAFIGGRYIVKSGSTYTMYQQAAFEADDLSGAPSEEISAPPVEPTEPTVPDEKPTVTPEEPEHTAIPSTPVDTFKWGKYDKTTGITAEEMRLACGVKLAMPYAEVEKMMNGFDSVKQNNDGQRTAKTAQKAGYTFLFVLIDGSKTSSNDYGLPHDGTYYLVSVTADGTCKDEFPRGIKIGDTIESVFEKIPAASTKLQQWKWQRLYGAYEYEPMKKCGWLAYVTATSTYNINAQVDGRESVTVHFDENNKVSSFDWIYN